MYQMRGAIAAISVAQHHPECCVTRGSPPSWYAPAVEQSCNESRLLTWVYCSESKALMSDALARLCAHIASSSLSRKYCHERKQASDLSTIDASFTFKSKHFVQYLNQIFYCHRRQSPSFAKHHG
jgi:hypothetical protein